jgi:hypothetical protein
VYRTDHALTMLKKHPLDVLGGGGAAARDCQVQHSLPHGHARDDVIHQVHRSLRHAPGAARGTETAPLAAKGQLLVVAALATAQL